MSKNVTMRDIARKMNISAVSVSKAISGHEGVSDSLRAEILKVADELGYNYAPKSAEKSLSIRVMVSETYSRTILSTQDSLGALLPNS